MKNKTPNPWTVKSRQIPYENPWIKVIHNEVLDPSGKEGIYGMVHFKNKAIAILPIDDEGYTWLVGQYRFPLDEYSWEIPQGGCPNGTDVLDTAKRELKEETGIAANQWTELMRYHTSNSVTDEFGIGFLARDLAIGQNAPESTEDISLKKVHFNEALEMVNEGKITDLISVACILKYASIS